MRIVTPFTTAPAATSLWPGTPILQGQEHRVVYSRAVSATASLRTGVGPRG